jgi:DNA-binding response OmpR family regulator
VAETVSARAANPRAVHVVAPDDMLVRALNQHAGEWQAVALGETPESDTLVIVDLDQPAERRRAVETLRGSGFTGPAIILGGQDAAAGPDDEPVARPVRLGALLARIEAHLSESDSSEVRQLGPYAFVPAEQLLRDANSDTVIRLTELERKLLLYLAAANGASVDREQLLAHVWGYTAGVDTHTVETHIWRLRQKIETDDPASRFLVTEAEGYRLLLVGSGQAG